MSIPKIPQRLPHLGKALLWLGRSIIVAFRSAKVAFFRGAKGDDQTLSDRALLIALVDLVELRTVGEELCLSVVPAGRNFCHRKQIDGWERG